MAKNTLRRSWPQSGLAHRNENDSLIDCRLKARASRQSGSSPHRLTLCLFASSTPHRPLCNVSLSWRSFCLICLGLSRLGKSSAFGFPRLSKRRMQSSCIRQGSLYIYGENEILKCTIRDPANTDLLPLPNPSQVIRGLSGQQSLLACGVEEVASEYAYVAREWIPKNRAFVWLGSSHPKMSKTHPLIRLLHA